MNTQGMILLMDGTRAEPGFVAETMDAARRLLTEDPATFRVLYEHCMDTKKELPPSALEKLRTNYRFIDPGNQVRFSIQSVIRSALWDHSPNEDFVLKSPKQSAAA